MRDFGVSF
jgi:hypothetical protein